MRNSKVSLVVLLALAVSATTLTGCGRKGLIKVNGEKIGKDEFYSRLEKVPVQTQGGVLPVPAGRYVIEQIIGETLVQQLAEKQGVAAKKEQVDKKIETVNKQNGGKLAQALLAQGLTMEEYTKKVTVEQSMINLVTKGITISDAEVKKAYDSALAVKNSPLKRPAQVMVSMVVVEKKPKIDKAYEMLQSGQDFGSVSMQMSEIPELKQSQGKLKWVSQQDKLLAPIKAAAFSLETGKYSKPVFLGGKNGWAIVKADQSRPAKTTSYAEAKDMIKEQMALQKGSMTSSFRKDLQAFTKAADITINAERYKSIVDNIKKQASAPLPESAKPNK